MNILIAEKTSSKNMIENLNENMSDEQLFALCQKYGEQARKWRQKFIGLLPEVFKRRLYEKKGFSSVFEFAAKLAGISAEQVRLTLNLEKRFEDKPALKNLLVNGEASINKLTRVVSIATVENEEELADKVVLLPKRALEVFVKDEKTSVEANIGAQSPTLFDEEGLPGQKLEFELAEDVVEKLNELQAKGIDVNDLLRKMLENREAEIAAAKKEISESIEPTNSRYISVKIKKILREEFGDKCSIKPCKKAAKQIHHTQRFALARTHDPHYLSPLCAEHHVIAHTVDVQFQRMRRGYFGNS